MFTTLLLLFCQPAAARLDSPDWATRETAERYLRSAGPLAWPALLRVPAVTLNPDGSTSCEAAVRAARLLVPRNRLSDAIHALLWLVPAEVALSDAQRLIGDPERSWSVLNGFRLCGLVEPGEREWWLDGTRPHEGGAWWWGESVAPAARVAHEIGQVRARVRATPGGGQ